MADKEKKRDLKRTVNNNLYALRIIHKAAPGLILFSVFNAAFNGFTAFLGNTYMLMYVLNALQTGEPVGKVLLTVGIILSVMLPSMVFNLLYEIFSEAKKVKIQEYVYALSYKKAAEIELGCFENPEFLDVYIKASSESFGRVTAVLDIISYTVWDIVNSISNITLIATVAPVFVLL